MNRMKNKFSTLSLRQLCVCALALWGIGSLSTAETNPPPVEVSAALTRMQDQINEQTRRIDRLFRMIGPEMEEMEKRADYYETQQREDKARAVEQICEVADEILTSLGCVNPAAAEFAVITSTGGIQIFDARGSPGKKFQQRGHIVTAVSFSPNGSELLAGTDAGALLVWDVAKGNCSTIVTNVGAKIARVTWLGNDRIVWAGTVDYWKEGGKPADHNKPAGAVLAREGGRMHWQFRSYVRYDFFTLAGTQDGSRLAVQEIPDQTRGAFLLDGKTGEVLQTCYDSAHGSGPLSVGISPDGNILAVGYAPRDIILWNVRTGERLKLLQGHSNWVVSLAYSADSKRLISGAGDSTARIWDLDSGEEIGRLRFPGPSTYVNSVGLSPKGDIAFALVDGSLVVAKAPSAKPSR